MSSYSGGFVDFIHELPKPEDVTAQQSAYINSQFINLKNTALANASLINGFPSVIDVPSFVDFMISNELASNVDGYQISTYFHKDRNGKLRAGPIWDFNLTYGNDLFLWGYDRSHFDVWQFSNGDNEGAEFWTDLFNNSIFKCYLSKRWNEVIQPGQPMNIDSMNAFIDSTVSYISAAAERENTLWGTIPNWENEILSMKLFLNQRITWITNNIGTFSACNNVPTPPLVITKINYNPSTNATFTNSNDQEFIEIKNIGTETVNVTGLYFRGTGFVYQFPANQTIIANSRVFLASKESVFTSRYGFAPYGEFTRNLSNSNQSLVLADGFGNIIDSVHYFDDEPWPNADGNGYFLQLSDTILDNSLASSWTAISNDLLSEKAIERKFVTITPNPVQNWLTVTATNSITEIQLFDLGGREIATHLGNSNNLNIDMSQLSTGMYLIKVTSGAATETLKVLKN